MAALSRSGAEQRRRSDQGNRAARRRLLKLKREKLHRLRHRQRRKYFLSDGALRRQLYPKHLQFFAAGLEYPERVFMAGNRVGKTFAGAYEMACHLEGQYPDWWEGTRFDEPVVAWANGKTAETTRDIVQKMLFGPTNELGTGMIAKERIGKITKRGGTPEAYDTVWIRWGDLKGPERWSKVTLKSYKQGRSGFEGEQIDVIWNDEEPPLDVYSEMLLRTTATKPDAPPGIILNTFTPLEGMSDTVMSFLDMQGKEDGAEEPDEDDEPSRVVIQCGWDDVPHIPPKEQKRLLASTPQYQHEARKNGTPILGSGAIYPIAESDVKVSPFKIPEHWPRFYGMDVGWRKTAGLWGAWDRDNDVIYIYHEYYRGQAEPETHVKGFAAPGRGLRGTSDPAARNRSQVDGRKLFSEYRELGLDIVPAKNTVEAGIFKVYERLTSGRLKVFSSCPNFWDEFRLYRRDDKGKVVKERDHLMDCMRYLVMMHVALAGPEPQKGKKRIKVLDRPRDGDWMGNT